MTIKLLFRLLFLMCFCSCFVNSNSRANGAGNKQFGLTIEVGQRQGMQYFDAANTEFNYRYFTITVTNDSTIPVHLAINLSEAEMGLSDTLQSKFFLLPRHLTPNEQQFDRGGMSDELKKFLDLQIDTPVLLDKTLKPTEKCVLTFGVLTARNHFDPTTPFDTELLTVPKNESEITVLLKLNDTLVIPCGHISYGK